MRGQGSTRRRLRRDIRPQGGDGDPPLHPRAWLLVRRGTHGGQVVSPHRAGVRAWFGSGMGRSSGLIIRRSQVRILPGPFMLWPSVAWICRRRAGFGRHRGPQLRHARMPSHGLAARSRSHSGPIGRRGAVRRSALGTGAKSPAARHSKSAQGAGAVVLPSGAGDRPGPGRRLGRGGPVGAVRGVRPQPPPVPRPADRHPRSRCAAARRPAAPVASGAVSTSVSAAAQNGDSPTSVSSAGALPAGWPAELKPPLERNVAAQLLWDRRLAGGVEPRRAAAIATFTEALGRPNSEM
jgi:hypothetical protein